MQTLLKMLKVKYEHKNYITYWSIYFIQDFCS